MFYFCKYHCFCYCKYKTQAPLGRQIPVPLSLNIFPSASVNLDNFCKIHCDITNSCFLRSQEN